MGDKLKLPVGIDDFEKSAEILFTTLTRQN